MKKIQCAISQCLLGDNVRYDGRSKLNAFINDELSTTFDWLPVCPEVGIGLGVPRPPIHLIQIAQKIHAVHVHNENNDLTDSLQQFGQSLQEKLKMVDAFILKARSPSCGLGSTPVQSESFLSNGIFAEQIKKQFPYLPLIDEEMIEDQKSRVQFFIHLYYYRKWKRVATKNYHEQDLFFKQSAMIWSLKSGESISTLLSLTRKQREETFFSILKRYLSLNGWLNNMQVATGKNDSLLFKKTEKQLMSLLKNEFPSAESLSVIDELMLDHF